MSTSPETSPVESEKGELEKANGLRREEDEEEQEREAQPVEIAEAGQTDLYLRAPLQTTQSHSSARSHRSHTDGYSHFGDEEKHDKEGAATAENDPGKEFEVTFDGDSDPMSPKNKSTLRKWGIVLIGSSCSLCVTCASALYTSTYPQIEREFGVGREVATLGLTTVSRLVTSTRV